MTIFFTFFRRRENDTARIPYIVTVNPESDKNITSQSKDKVDNMQGNVYEVVKRFVKVFETHGIQQNQIPFFVDKKFDLKLKDFKDEESILEVLNEELINWTCNKFGIQKEWIEGTTNRIYCRTDYYKQIHIFIEDVCKLMKEGKSIELLAFKNGNLNNRNDIKHFVVLLFRCHIGNINSKPVYKYIPISTLWDWSYWRSRYQLKSIFFICEKLRVITMGYDTIDKNIIASGEDFPQNIINNIPITITWYPEDYIDLPSRSVQAKEIDETEEVRSYIKKQGYIDYLQKCIKS